MQRIKSRLLVTSLGTSLLLLAAPAFAGTTVVGDPDDDAWAVTTSGIIVGDHDIDLRSVLIDHGTQSLQLVSTFSFTNADSWTDLQASIDTNLDDVADYTVLWSKDYGVAGVLDAAENVTCSTIGTSEKYGVNGTVTMTIPRTCLGSPRSLAIHVDAFWFGTSQADTDLTFVDSAPGLFIDEPTAFSAPVASSNTGSVTSPQAPAPVPGKTRVTAKLSKKSQTFGKAAAKLTIRVAGDPAGTVQIADGRKVLKRLPVKAGKSLVFKLPRKLKPGTHRLKVTFTPADKTSFAGSSQTVKLRVRR